MATYEELHELKSNSKLLDKVETACIIAAGGIVSDGSPPTNQVQRLKWAAETFERPRAMAAKMLPAVLAANKDATVGNIQGATDVAIQANVDTSVDLFADLIT